MFATGSTGAGDGSSRPFIQKSPSVRGSGPGESSIVYRAGLVMTLAAVALTIGIAMTRPDPFTRSPTVNPTQHPTGQPTTSMPTKSPTVSPTWEPTTEPTQNPTVNPTQSPTRSPTRSPTLAPTRSPTLATSQMWIYGSVTSVAPAGFPNTAGNFYTSDNNFFDDLCKTRASSPVFSPVMPPGGCDYYKGLICSNSSFDLLDWNAEYHIQGKPLLVSVFNHVPLGTWGSDTGELFDAASGGGLQVSFELGGLLTQGSRDSWYTGCNNDGTASAFNCAKWTSNLAGDSSTFGSFRMEIGVIVPSNEWLNFATSHCGNIGLSFCVCIRNNVAAPTPIPATPTAFPTTAFPTSPTSSPVTG